MIGQFNDCNLAYFTKTRAGKKEGYYRTPDYRIGNRPHTAKFKVVRNVRLFTLYSIDSNLQDEIAGHDGIRKWTFLQTWRKKIFRKLSTIRIYEVKYLWGIVKQIQYGLFWEVVKITGPSVLDVGLLPSASSREVVSHIQHLGSSNFYYFSQYHVVFV